MSPIAGIALFVILVLAGIFAGVWSGQKVGRRFQDSSKKYWIANGVVVIVGIPIAAFVSLVPGVLGVSLVDFLIGFITGAITGLKYGYGKSVGIWKKYDDWAGNDRDIEKKPWDKRDRDIIDVTAKTTVKGKPGVAKKAASEPGKWAAAKDIESNDATAKDVDGATSETKDRAKGSDRHEPDRP